MATGLPTDARPEGGATVEEKVARFRPLFADAPQYAKTAVENVLDELKSQVEAKPPASRMESGGRAGSRQGKVSELTLLVPWKTSLIGAPRSARSARAASMSSTTRYAPCSDPGAPR